MCDGLPFPAVYEQHRDAVFAVARRIGVPHLAPDVTQETFVHLWRHPTRFDPSRGSLRSFLVMVARSLAIDRARSETARVNREDRTSHQRRHDAADHSAGLLAEERADEVSAALGRLNPDCRDAIVAAFYGGLTYNDVAAALGEPEGTVKSRIRRGLIQLREELEQLDPHPLTRPHPLVIAPS
jgi:RNA polymerase sigma-70 factor (ECF subfamily)